MSGTVLRLSKKCFIKCKEGHRAYKIPGEKHSFWCPDCEVKITSDAKPYYTSQFDKKRKGNKKKCRSSSVNNGITKGKHKSKSKSNIDFDLIEAHACITCFHKDCCFRIKDLTDDELARVCCSRYYGSPCK